MKNDRKQKLKAIELFAGAGGMAVGLQQAGVEVVGVVEKDDGCLATLGANHDKFFPKARLIKADLSQAKGRDILAMVGLKRGVLDILSGGPPCQGFTWANKKRSINDPRSAMMWHFIRLVGEIQPRYFVIENVPGLLSFKDFFAQLMEDLEGKGYVVRFNMMDAASYGVPQRRIRVFIEGARNDTKLTPIFPEPTHFDPDNEKAFPPASWVAIKCFAVHGFSKEQVKDVWWNSKLGILMAKKNAAEQVVHAVHQILLEGLLGQIQQKRKQT